MVLAKFKVLVVGKQSMVAHLRCHTGEVEVGTGA